MGLVLVIGDRTWSSWSMRPWLVLCRSGLAFETVSVRLRRGERTAAAIRDAGSPTGFVPILREGDAVLWDSLAICERVAELAPEAGLWPADPKVRAAARSATAEMHAGFAALRSECPMDLARAPGKIALSAAAEKDLRRLVDLFCALRRAHGAAGPYLCGRWSVADAFFTPVAARFHAYAVDPADFGDAGDAKAYLSALLAAPEYRRWEADAAQEREGR